MRFTPDFLDELRSRVSLVDTIARKVRLSRKGREHTGLCPFHNEKTPSFTVSEEKGFYHCFGCGAHGDIIRFMMEQEGYSFPEAVERLAGQAGMPLPVETPEERKKQERRAGLAEVMQMAADWYQSQLQATAGKEARAYLEGRGLSEKTIEHFHLGLASASRTALKEALRARDVEENQMVEAGLLIKPEEGGESFDRFRNRIMFPIMDQRERCIAFGGRALDPAAKAKYLNSPETPLFHKGRTLYNLGSARKSAFKAGDVIVVEGYMDVIALHQAGMENTVAPLGTAVTEDQLQLLWRMAPEPVLCFDGDKAGQGAALRAMERSLPLLRPGHSLRFALLPEGEDPDSLVKSSGLKAFKDILDSGHTLADVLWASIVDSHPINTPERRAGLEKKVFDSLSAITDDKVKSFYMSEFRRRLNKLFYPAKDRSSRKPFGSQSGWKEKSYPAQKAGGIKNTPLGRQKGEASVTFSIEELLVLTVINHPAILISHLEDFAVLQFASHDMQILQNAILDWAAEESSLEKEGLRNHLLEIGCENLYTRLIGSDSHKSVWSAWPDAQLADAEKGWTHTLNRYRFIEALKKEKRAIQDELAENWTEEGYERLKALTEEIETAAGNEAELEGYGLASGRSQR